MAKSASGRPTTQPSGHTLGWAWAFVYMFTIVIDLAFVAFVLIMDYDLWIALAAGVVFTVLVSMSIRHLHTGEPLGLPGVRRGRVLPAAARFLMGGLQAVAGAPDDSGQDNPPASPKGEGK